MIVDWLRFKVQPLRWRWREWRQHPPQSDHETCARLFRLARRQGRREPGQFDFSFGRLRFLDALSVAHQFEDIFLKRGYDLLESPGSIIDCGGNIGLSVVRFKQNHPSCRITVYEADPAIAAVLQENVQALRLENVTVIHAAVWIASGTVPFNSNGADGGHIADVMPRQVAAVRLADTITGPVDLLKLDIEGAEFAVLADLCESGKIANVRRIVCEVHQRQGDEAKVAALFSHLVGSGFKICVTYARPAPDLPGSSGGPTPFWIAPDERYILQLYAWRA